MLMPFVNFPFRLAGLKVADMKPCSPGSTGVFVQFEEVHPQPGLTLFINSVSSPTFSKMNLWVTLPSI